MKALRPEQREVNAARKARAYLVIKRAFDLMFALAAFVCLAPLMAAIALLIRLDSPGPALFVQTRIGKGGRPFAMLKFRTLYHGLDSSAHRAFMQAFVKGKIARNGKGNTLYKPFDKSHVTQLGRFLRQTSLDELPQLINVLKGEMSLVGPRPNVPWEVEAYEPWHMERLQVLPGMTGLAQVNGRSGIDFDTIVKYDIEYVRRQCLMLDMQIVWDTVRSVVRGKGAH
jgi:lipopolysaccharide/colanic/teichoic acid biosynthesis glycosyltransferase